MDRLELMQQFVSVAEAKSLSSAARRLGCTEPTLSKRIAFLEESLRAKLLVRNSKGVRLTEAGDRYVQACRRLLAELREVEGSLTQLRGALHGALRVYLPLTLGEEPLTRIAVDFQRRHPELSLDVAVQDGWIDLASTGGDLAIRIGAVLDPSVVARSLGGLEFVLVASPSYLLAAGVPSTLEALSGHEYLRLGGEDEEPLVTPEGSQLVRVHGAITFNNPRSVKSATLAGAGIGRLARWLVHEELSRGDLVEVLPGIAPPPLPICAVYLPTRYPVEKIRAFIRFVGEALEKLPGWIPPSGVLPAMGAPSTPRERAEDTVREWLGEAPPSPYRHPRRRPDAH